MRDLSCKKIEIYVNRFLRYVGNRQTNTQAKTLLFARKRGDKYVHWFSRYFGYRQTDKHYPPPEKAGDKYLVNRPDTGKKLLLSCLMRWMILLLYAVLITLD